MKCVIFLNNMVCPPIAPSRQKGHDKSHKKYKKNTKATLLNLMIFMLKRKMFLKNMINRNQVKANVLTMVNLDTTVKTANTNLVKIGRAHV